MRTIDLKVPAGVELEDVGTQRTMFKIYRKRKRLDQACRVWTEFATTYVLYMDDSLLADPDKDDIDEVIK